MCRVGVGELGGRPWLCVHQPNTCHPIPAAASGTARAARCPGSSHRREFCHLADTPSPSLLRRLLEERGVQQNGSLADGYLAAWPEGDADPAWQTPPALLARCGERRSAGREQDESRARVEREQSNTAYWPSPLLALCPPTSQKHTHTPTPHSTPTPTQTQTPPRIHPHAHAHTHARRLCEAFRKARADDGSSAC